MASPIDWWNINSDLVTWPEYPPFALLDAHQINFVVVINLMIEINMQYLNDESDVIMDYPGSDQKLEAGRSLPAPLSDTAAVFEIEHVT